MPSTLPMGESINRRFRIIVTVLYMVVVGLLLWLFATQWRGYWDAQEALKEFNVVEAALRAMADVSSERRPTVAVVMLKDAPPQVYLAAQQAARRQTDAHMSDLDAALRDPDCRNCGAILPQWEETRTQLAQARQNLDALANNTGTTAEIVDGFKRMVAVIPMLSSIAQTSSTGVIRENADVQSFLLVARLSGLLREQAGMIGQQFAPALVMHRQLTDEEDVAIIATVGKIEQLQQLLLPSIRLLPPSLQADYADMERRYFGEAISQVQKLRSDALSANGSDETLMQLADRYGPLVAPINKFRDDSLALAGQTIDESLHLHLIYLIASGVLALALTALLLLMIWRFREKVIRPFAEARRFILAIAAGDLAVALPTKHYGSEVRELFSALKVLKENDAKRQRLELERNRLIDELRILAETDTLTGLLNRRSFESRAKMLLSDKRGDEQVIALMMLDIDFFKRGNDTYGHESGDKALVMLATLCRQTVRTEDVVARFGGEEFVILLRVRAASQALAIAEHLRQRLHEETVTSTDGRVFNVTVSVGIAYAKRTGSAILDTEQLLREADALLYRAKENGRDRIETAADL
ncbi:GGDEF domain-containing protein [Dyella sp. C11]|uniref:GGDEF domain-containing protein n=1 Tax=Dyella sp. C11 TaxID=2126991 RepID=UPI0013009D96|nr:GGDEF domain-containing protein [Dyella sp. C11]